MSFIIPPEELTTEGPYRIADPRPLSFMEIAYTELMLQMEMLQALEMEWEIMQAAQTVETLENPQAAMIGLLRHPVPATLKREPALLAPPIAPTASDQAALGPLS